MRKHMLTILVVAAVLIYGWNIYMFTHSGDEEESVEVAKRQSDISVEELLASAEPIAFVVKGRSPFTPHPIKVRSVPVRKTRRAVNRAPKEEPKPPLIKVTGTIWNDKSPLVMVTLPDGSSTVAKTGDELGEITIKKIKKNRMQVFYKNRNFWITW